MKRLVASSVSFVVFAVLAAGVAFPSVASGYEVSVARQGERSGTVKVTSTPAGINCPTDCTAEFPDGTPVTLFAQAGPKTRFEGFWFVGNSLNGQGHCAGNNGEVDQCHLAGVDDAVLNLQYFLVPEPGITGVSINDGDIFTNDPRVELSIRWPFGSVFTTVSNDGGFGKSKEFELKSKIPWTLQSSGPERLPKTVYVLFNGGGTRYTDDIILDQTPPVVTSVSASNGASASTLATRSRSRVNRSRSRRVLLRVRASDRTSGVSKIQIGPRKSSKLKKLKFRSRMKVAASGRKLWLRVFDRAGNASRWKLAKVR